MDPRSVPAGLRFLRPVTILLLAFLAAGCTQRFETGFNAGDGSLVVIQRADPTAMGRAARIADQGPVGLELIKQVYTRRDYLFVVTYELGFRSSAPLGPALEGLTSGLEPFDLMVELPGTITHHNADQVAGNRALWRMEPGRPLDIEVRSRAFRVWLLILPLLIVAAHLIRRRRR